MYENIDCYWYVKIYQMIVKLYEELDHETAGIPYDVAKISAYRIAIQELKKLVQ